MNCVASLFTDGSFLFVSLKWLHPWLQIKHPPTHTYTNIIYILWSSNYLLFSKYWMYFPSDSTGENINYAFGSIVWADLIGSIIIFVTKIGVWSDYNGSGSWRWSHLITDNWKFYNIYSLITCGWNLFLNLLQCLLQFYLHLFLSLLFLFFLFSFFFFLELS